MSVKRVKKEALATETIIFVNSDKENEFESISPSFAYNFIDIVSLDGIAGDPCAAGQGQYQVFVKTDLDGGFKTIAGGNIIKAIDTGGDTLADGETQGLVFIGTPLEIKIVPSGVDCAAYKVHITQLSDQLDKTPDDFLNAFEDVDGVPALRVKISNGVMEGVVDAIRQLGEQNERIIKQLLLLNLRIEEIGDTELTDDDIELEQEL